MSAASTDRQGHVDGQPEGTLPALLTVSRAATMLGISRASAYRYAASGELPVRRLGGRVYVVTARLLAMVDGTAA